MALITEEEAQAIVRRIQKPMLEFVASIAAPLYWPAISADGKVTVRNGTAFFLKTEKALFGVTAAHVIEGQNGWRAHCEINGNTQVRLAGRNGTSVPFDWDARIVDIDVDMDIATFAVLPREVEHINRTHYSGSQIDWPPDLRKKGKALSTQGSRPSARGCCRSNP